MSTSVLYRALGLRGYEHQSIRQQEGGIVMRMRPTSPVTACPKCQGRNIVHRGTVPKSWSTPPIGRYPVTVFAAVPRIECRDCRCQPVVPVPFADPRRSYTRSFERLVLDLDTGAVVFVGKGKGEQALKPFWKRLKSSGAKVEAVAMDMSAAYYRAVTENLPRAAVVFDGFHVVKRLNDKLSDLRRELYREAKDQLHKDVLKGTRWLLLKRPEHLDDDRGERQRLEEALKLNESLAIADYLKENLRQLWEQPAKAAARRFLDDWLRQAASSGIRVLKTFSGTLAAYRSGLLAWYDHPISTGPLEGTNNKIKTLKRQACGFRDQEYFTLKILALHHSRWKLVG